MVEDLILTGLMGGFAALIDYLAAHVLTCLIPAFFIAGAMNALLQKEAITKYLGAATPRYKAYPVAVASGLLLAVCSCTILPLFAGIKKKGAGIGPAVAFLYTAPATNIIAVSLTWSVIGADFAIARIVLSITFAVIIGLILSTLFKEKTPEATPDVPISCACGPGRRRLRGRSTSSSSSEPSWPSLSLEPGASSCRTGWRESLSALSSFPSCPHGRHRGMEVVLP